MRTCTVLAVGFFIMLACTSIAFADGQNPYCESQQSILLVDSSLGTTVEFFAIADSCTMAMLSEDSISAVYVAIDMADFTGHDTYDPETQSILAFGLTGVSCAKQKFEAGWLVYN